MLKRSLRVQERPAADRHQLIEMLDRSVEQPRFVEWHAIDLRPSIKSDELTISITELLFTKLQIVRINEKTCAHRRQSVGPSFRRR